MTRTSKSSQKTGRASYNALKMPRKSDGSGGGGKDGHHRKHRFRPGTVAKREIRHEQQSTKSAFRFAPFYRGVKEGIAAASDKPYRVTGNAVQALMHAVQEEGISLINSAYDLALNVANRRTLKHCDIRAAHRMRQNMRGVPAFVDHTARVQQLDDENPTKGHRTRKSAVAAGDETGEDASTAAVAPKPAAAKKTKPAGKKQPRKVPVEPAADAPSDDISEDPHPHTNGDSLVSVIAPQQHKKKAAARAYGFNDDRDYGSRAALAAM